MSLKSTLHICSNYSCTKLYRELFGEQLLLGLKLNVFIPERQTSRIGRFWIENESINYSQPICIKPYDKLTYHAKIKRSADALVSDLSLSDVNGIHAHTLFTDGGVAYELWKKYKVPYVITVRNVDVNCFLKYAVHLRRHGGRILANASKIIFLSSSYKNRVLHYYNKTSDLDLEKKCVVIPNGIASQWFDRPSASTEVNDPLRISYVTENFYKNKNPFTAVDVAQRLNDAGISAEIRMVGRGKSEEELRKKPFVKLYGNLNSREEMIGFYEKSDIFLLPSQYESFGLVYAEAISRGIPVLYTKDQGFDGHFPDGDVGFPIIWNDSNDIVNKLMLCLDGYQERSIRCIDRARLFNWSNIASEYCEIYLQSLKA